MILRLPLFIFCLFLCAALPARAATRDDLQKVESQLNEKKEQAEELEEKARDAASGLGDLRQKLINATGALQQKEEEQDRLEEKLEDLSQDIDEKKKSLFAERRRLAILTGALIEIARQPPETKFLQSGLTADHIHRAILLRAVLPRIRDEAADMAGDLASLAALQVQMAEQKHLVIYAQENLQGQQRDLDALIRTRQGLLQKTEAQRQSITRQLASLSSEAKDLRELLEKVSPQKKQPKKAGAFTGLQPALRPPVSGSVIRTYGARDADGVLSQGLTYTAPAGSPVVAPRAGKVVFAGPFRGYGQILILQHDGGYHSFLAGFGRIDADMGQQVETGEPLGVLPARGEKGGEKGAAKPELYFEWRRNNEPVDPTRGIALSKSP